MCHGSEQPCRWLYNRQGRHADAEPLLKQSLAMRAREHLVSSILMSLSP